MLGKKLCSQLLDGNMTDHKTYISGTCKGFHVTVDNTETGAFRFRISAHSDNDPDNAALRNYAEYYKNTTEQIQSFEVSSNCVTVVSTRTVLAKKIPEHLNEGIMPIIDYLANNLYVTGCMQCGTQYSDVDCYNINGAYHYLCSDCVEKVEGTLEDRKQAILSNKSKLIPGIVGALLGSLIGCLAYFLIWQLGFVSAFAGLITAVCAFKGYEMLGKTLDKKGVIVCVIVIIFAVFFSNKLVWAYTIYSELKSYPDFNDYNINFFDCFRVTGDLVKEAGLTGEYVGNIVMSLFMTALGSFGSIVGALKSSSGSYKVKKMKN